MRRAIARGRIVPQSLSTDPRYGHLSLKAQVLYPLLWINCDDQGRLSGDPDEIKYTACPSVKEILTEEIPLLLKEMETQGMIKVYSTSRSNAIQMLDWWEEQHLQWAYPSRYSPPPEWQDRLRYHATPTEIIIENWPASRAPKEEPLASKTLPSKLPKALPSKLESPPLATPPETEKEDGKGRGKGRSPSTLPSVLGSKSSPSPSPVLEIYNKFTDCYEKGWGQKTDGKSLAQIRDYAEELSAAGCPASYVHDAFKEAAAANKYHLSYVRGILLDWLGVERKRSPSATAEPP